MKYLRPLCSLFFCVAAVLFFALAYPHHLHYQEQYQLFLFDSGYVWDIVSVPGGVADLLGRFCTQFFLFAWVGAAIIGVLLALVQLLTLYAFAGSEWRGWLYGLSYVPAFMLWLFLLDENALLGGVWAVLLTLPVVGLLTRWPAGWLQRLLTVAAVVALYGVVGPLWVPADGMTLGTHYYRYPTETPWLLWAAALSAVVIPIAVRLCRRPASAAVRPVASLVSFALVAVMMGTLVWKNSNFKAERVMHYDFMARYGQWNRILETIRTEKPNNQIGVTVQNLALAMHGMLVDHLFEYNQNGILGLLPDVGTDAISPLPTSEAFYQLGMINIAHRTVFEAQEAILDFQKSGRCYKRLAQTNLINGNYEVARKYLSALQKTLFYSQWANETLPLLGDEAAIARHPEYGRLRQMVYKEDFYFSDHVTPEMLERLYLSNKSNRLAYQYLLAYYMLTGDRERYTKFLPQLEQQ